MVADRYPPVGLRGWLGEHGERVPGPVQADSRRWVPTRGCGLPGATFGPSGAGAWYQYGYTFVAEKGKTPEWAQSALHTVSRVADPDYGEIYEAFTRPDQWSDRIGGWIYDVLFGGGEEMAPGPIGEAPGGELS